MTAILFGCIIGFTAWFLVRYLAACLYTVNQNERAVKTSGCITKFFTLGCKIQGIVACGMFVGPLFPEIVPFAALFDTAQGQDVLGAVLRPEHARLFAARANHRFATGLNHA